jgi:hypothetical protein
MANALSNPTVVMNNLVVAIVPNSFSFTEGLGEQTVRVQSAGGGSVQTVVSNNVETNKSGFKYSLYNTIANIDLAKTWKQNLDANATSVTGEGLDRSFSGVVLINNYEVNLGSDTTIDLEFESQPAI